jgi:cytosine permease
MKSEYHGSLDQEDEAHDEFHSRPVPLTQRLGFGEPALVWSGFGIAFICAVIGGLIQQGLGTVDAILAIMLGNLILFLYSALIAYPSGKWGINFPLTVKYVFGSSGAVVPVLVLAVLVTGWYAFQAWLTADILRVAFNLEGAALVGLIAAIAAIIFAIPVIFGIHQIALVRKVAIPAMIVFAGYYLIARIIPEGGAIFQRQGDGSIGFMTGVGMAWSTFVVSGTMTGDIVRYTRNGNQALGVTAVAFIFSNAPFMIMGALISATINNPEVNYFFDQRTLVVLIPLVSLAILSNWSTCDACLYNASMGFTNSIPGFNWRRAAIFGSIIGVIAAATGIIGDIVGWLILLGLLVPPIGGTIVADYYVIRAGIGFAVGRDRPVNWAAILATAIGVIIAYWVNVNYPQFLFGAAGILSSFIVYVVLAKVAPAALGAELGRSATGAQAEGVPVASAAE